jgi:hypothetical protein
MLAAGGVILALFACPAVSGRDAILALLSRNRIVTTG